MQGCRRALKKRTGTRVNHVSVRGAGLIAEARPFSTSALTLAWST